MLLARYLEPGCRVAVADGAGSPLAGVGAALGDAARAVGDVSLLLGWCFEVPPDLDLGAFARVRSLMSGYALRKPLREGRIGYLPVRLGSVASLLRSSLRPDVVVVAVRPGRRGWAFGSEVAWMQAAVAAGATVVAEVNHALPRAAAVPEIPKDEVVVLSEVDRPPVEVDFSTADAVARAIGKRVAALIPEDAVVQYGPGAIADAALAALDVPIAIDSGVVTDAAHSLDERGLLRGTPSGAYVVGSPGLHDWADGRSVAHGFEHTHDVSRLAAHSRFVAVNTALEIDAVGQVNVERVGDDPVGAIGGHPDYAAAAAGSPEGISIVALPSVHRGRRTLVERLSAPVSTPRADVDVVVTESGVADLRGLRDEERARAIEDLWGQAARMEDA